MNPELNILIVNYNEKLANRFGARLRQLFIDNADLLASRDIYLSKAEHAKASFRFENSKGEFLGTINLVGTGGTITGTDVDICICDDLIKGFKDTTKRLLDDLYEWFKEIIIPRLEPHSKLFVLGTRWHTRDIIGRLKEEHPDKYDFIELKALNEDGTCIWPNKYTPEFFEERREEVGSRVFEAQYQGQPLDETGDFFNLDNLYFEDVFDHKTHYTMHSVRSWDLAYSEEDGGKNDSTAGILMHKINENHYVINQLKYGQYGDDLKKVLKETAKADKTNIPILIETGTRGGAAKFLYNEYEEYLTGYRTKQSEPIGTKADRATPFSNAVYDGKVHVCINNNEQRELFLSQLKSFPNGKHDDLVDACAYGYLWLSKHSNDTVGTAGKRRRARI
jgi:phage terminase large subunit-like protein